MNATTTILPRRSDRRTRAPAGSRSANSGAGAITLRCGRALIASDAGGTTFGSSCADAARQSASASANEKNCLTASSVEEHVVRTRRTDGRLAEVDREDGIELHPAVGTDVDETQGVTRRVVDAADGRIGEVKALPVVGDVHHVRLHHALHRVVQAGRVRRRDVPGLHLAAPEAAHVEVLV